MNDFQNKLVVITGAASGIGAALARQFAAEDARLCLTDNNQGRLRSIEQEISSHVVKTYCFDVGDYPSFVKMGNELEKDFGGADVLINNAGVALGKMTAEETSIEQFEWLMKINFWGMVNGSKVFLPQLKKKSESVLVNVSSLFGLVGVDSQSSYCASKFAIRGYTEALMVENRHNGLTIHAVHPGGVNTNISLNAKGGDKAFNQIFHDKFLSKRSPEKAAKIIIQGIRKNKKRIIIGAEAKLGELAARIFPISLISFIQKYFLKDFN
ncbi:MAG: SDR family NAD(P)-dependent oxidoreductase [Chitinophagales bacterium]|nr:SDR family NAD(P)-dependent oxidoreductase [Chitinophagales bacterium]